MLMLMLMLMQHAVPRTVVQHKLPRPDTIRYVRTTWADVYHTIHFTCCNKTSSSRPFNFRQGEGRSNTNMMTTLEIVGKAIEIAEAAVEQMEEQHQELMRHYHADDDDANDQG
jgi:hypothetical protein